MRIGFIGKGGSGKSTLAGTVGRLLARQGDPVLALDVDTMPGLSFSLGLGRVPDQGLPPELAEKREGQGWVLREERSAGELVDRYAVDGPDGVRFLQLGKLPAHVHPGSIAAFRHVVNSFRRAGWSVVGDLAAGTRQFSFGWARFASLLALVVEPTPAARETARRLRRLAEKTAGARVGLVVNQVRDEGSLLGLEEDVGLPVWGRIPHDEAVRASDRAGAALVDSAPRSPACRAVEELVSRLRALEQEGPRGR